MQCYLHENGLDRQLYRLYRGEQSRQKDRIDQFTDSLGQQKCFLVALKFAQYELMKDSYGFPPILLLDDLFDKLDLERSEKLLEMVCGKEFGQIFLSNTSMERVLGIINKFTTESICYKVKNGEFSL